MPEVVVLDGGMGKELRRIGAPFGQPEWSALALMEQPPMVAQAHHNFVDAGADVLITNTYGVVPHHIGADRFESTGYELASLAGRIARDVADAAERDILVAGSLPPLFGSYRPERFDAEAAPSLWRVLFDALDPWVDLWLGETIGGLAEFEVLAKLVAGDDRPFWAAFALSDELHEGRARLRTGVGVNAIAVAAGEVCAAVLFNCSQPEVITAAIPELAKALREQGSSTRFGAYANAFAAGVVEDGAYASNERTLERRSDLTPDRYAGFARRWIEDGATIVGGCCDIYPAHIGMLRSLVDSF